MTKSQEYCLWSGQHVLEEHVKYLQFSDFTNGYHCGYLSPMPSIEFDGVLEEDTFHRFTDALSSDVLKWEYVQKTIQSAGVTYADKNVLMEHKAQLVAAVHGAKYISGGNLGINLTVPEKTLPFFNPPGARGGRQPFEHLHYQAQCQENPRLHLSRWLWLLQFTAPGCVSYGTEEDLPL